MFVVGVGCSVCGEFLSLPLLRVRVKSTAAEQLSVVLCSGAAGWFKKSPARTHDWNRGRY